MDSESIYNKRGRILSFEEARNLYLERNPNRASFHESSTHSLRHPHSQFVHSQGTLYWANQGNNVLGNADTNHGSLGRGATLVQSISPNVPAAPNTSSSAVSSCGLMTQVPGVMSPSLIASLHGYTQLIPQKVTSHTLATSPLSHPPSSTTTTGADTVNYIPLESSSNSNYMLTKIEDQQDDHSNYSFYLSVDNQNNPRSSHLSYFIQLLHLSSIVSKVSQFTKDLVDILVNLNKFFLILLIGSIFMLVFSLSMIFCLTVIWPHSVSLSPLGIYYEKKSAGLDGYDKYDGSRNYYSLTTPKVADTIASPPKHTLPPTTPSAASTSITSANFTNQSSFSSSSTQYGVRSGAGALGSGVGGGVIVDKYSHLPLIGSCFVNWTRVMFTWSYHNSLLPHSSPTEQLILSQLNSYCMLKMVLKGRKLIGSQQTTLPANADNFNYYRNGERERDGNIAFLISISPCFNIPTSNNSNGTMLPYMVTNKHLNTTSNYSSMVVVMERKTGKKYKCNSIYDMNELQQLDYFTKLVKEHYEKFVNNCAKQCSGGSI